MPWNVTPIDRSITCEINQVTTSLLKNHFIAINFIHLNKEIFFLCNFLTEIHLIGLFYSRRGRVSCVTCVNGKGKMKIKKNKFYSNCKTVWFCLVLILPEGKRNKKIYYFKPNIIFFRFVFVLFA